MEEKKKGAGGKRVGAGRKPSNNPKVQISLYVPTADIWKFGNESKMKECLNAYISNFGKPDSNGLGIQKEIQGNPQAISDTSKYILGLLKTFQEHMNEIAELQYEDEYRKKYAEIEAATNLSDKQKQLLYQSMKTSKI